MDMREIVSSRVIQSGPLGCRWKAWFVGYGKAPNYAGMAEATLGYGSVKVLSEELMIRK